MHFLCHSYTTRSIRTPASVYDKVNSSVEQPDEEAAFLPFFCVQVERRNYSWLGQHALGAALTT